MADAAPAILSKCNAEAMPVVTDSQSKATEILAQNGTLMRKPELPTANLFLAPDFKLMATLQTAQRSFMITGVH